ncbi:MAG: hypothetical protein KA052_01265 [Candidatus Pacebacteria bacterium]|nr:hypothetical protein [Candidatus Paceibacterota bacterium]
MKDIRGKIRQAFRGHSRTKIVIFLLLLLLCIIELFHITFLWRTYKYENKFIQNYEGTEVSRTGRLVSPSEIDWWMTFSYINFVFELPPNYLKDNLGLVGEEYPGIQIKRYARIYNLDSIELVEQIQEAVHDYKK